ncbi:IS3 family transposase [Bulleidia extructa]|uniref:IS3 family transposase n=1 Tax=Bulleidia extructa TaxID=118748 RepID=UPI003BEFFD27
MPLFKNSNRPIVSIYYKENRFNHVIIDTTEYIHYDNKEKIQTKLKDLTPCQARNQASSCLSIKVSKNKLHFNSLNRYY